VRRTRASPPTISVLASQMHLKYLCKEDDALRKDMRMMESESFVNHILSHARQCHQRDLAVMNERCGTASAPHICRTRYKSFVPHILPAFPPVMHLWFVAHVKVIARWFQTRLKYARSIDRRLGDRHAENILFSEHSGASLHVDFSCLFDRFICNILDEMAC
jgi:serine/threonine-protein kinase ATR